MIELEQDGIRWIVAPDFQPLLGRTLADAGQVVKSTPTKLVTVHQVGGRTVYVKKYLNAAKWLRPLKYYFKTSEAKSEWALAAEVKRRGIPVVPHLAVGEHWTRGGLQQSLIITEGFDGVRLDRFTAQHTDELQTALAHLLRAMHDNGVLQEDLHHNIMVKARPLELCRIDVDRGELLPPLNEDQRVENLSYINVFVPLRERFFEVYRSLNGAGFQATSEFVAAIRRRSAEIRRRLFARRSGRCLEHNLRFNPVRLGGLRWWVRIDCLNDRLKALLADPDGALTRGQRMFKSGPHRQSTVGAFDGVVLKRFNTKNRLNYFKNLFRSSRAFRAYQKAYHLELLGLPTPKPIAAAERRVMRVLLNSYLVTEEIPGAMDLGAIFKSGTKGDRALARQAGQLIGRMHNEGFSHADLKETNIVRGYDGRLQLLDLDALDFMKRLPNERAAADLARLLKGANKFPAVARAERTAFLLAYCRSRNLRRVPRLTPAPD